jgi:hypothetical protein
MRAAGCAAGSWRNGPQVSGAQGLWRLLHFMKELRHPEGSRTLSRMLSVLACTLLAFSGCRHFGDDALRKDVADPVDRVQVGVAQEEPVADIDECLIDPSTEAFVQLYGPTIKRYAGRYGVDWRLVLATVKQESGFSVDAKSHRGATGLMQIMPVTSEELSRILNLEDMSHPHDNIRGGVYYMGRLYSLFPGAQEGDRIRLTLAAYNAGMGRVFDAQALAAHLRMNPLSWESVKSTLSLLSRRDQALHRTVWSQDRPRSGWFVNPGETLQYVENVMGNYDDYRLMFN